MTNEEFSQLIHAEEEKRLRCWDPRDRWRVIEATIAWVDDQQPVSRNSRQACLANQERLLQGLGQRTQTSGEQR